MMWPYDTNIQRIKSGGPHFTYTADRPACFIIVPRRKKAAVAGWKDREYRFYNWKQCMNIHTAGAWEYADGKAYIETTRVHGNVFPFISLTHGQAATGEAKADFVRWTIDLAQPSDSWLKNPIVLLDLACEFPRIDERLASKKHNIVFLNEFLPNKADGTKNVIAGLNGLAMLNTTTG